MTQNDSGHDGKNGAVPESEHEQRCEKRPATGSTEGHQDHDDSESRSTGCGAGNEHQRSTDRTHDPGTEH